MTAAVAATPTRERILDVALQLFIERGYEKTSLREIAEALGLTKAAVYYHFASKDDILAALHMRLHDLLRAAFADLADPDAGPDAWVRLLDLIIDGMVVSRDLFVMHERNRAAVEALHVNGRHADDHQDIEAQLQRILSDGARPLRERVRLACALGAVLNGVMMFSDAFARVPSAELADLVRESVADLLQRQPSVS